MQCDVITYKPCIAEAGAMSDEAYFQTRCFSTRYVIRGLDILVRGNSFKRTKCAAYNQDISADLTFNLRNKAVRCFST